VPSPSTLPVQASGTASSPALDLLPTTFTIPVSGLRKAEAALAGVDRSTTGGDGNSL
jgi:hypothetical protein